ncbi:M48 family metalloprotease [Chitinimonas sp.]|uniref:M48 family metalloprotease n=1 Tax=Chitinimonas sp. TaxID=1934313 RepID=UPI0035B2823E
MKMRLISLALLPILALATDLPDLGDSALGDLPLHEERRISDMVARELRKSGDVEDDPELNDYLNRLGSKLAASSNDSRVNFRFFPISSAQINAWAVPGGVISVNLGLLVLTQHESELASVMAHEIGHVTQHHYARMVETQKGSGLMTLASLAVAILAARSNPDAAQGALAASEGYQLQRYLSFSRDFEREADRVGMQTLQAAGFDAGAMPVFFDRMQHFYRNVDNGAFAFLRTHPVTTERIADSQARAAKLPYRQWVDSPDYLFMREKARAIQLGGQDALRYYEGTTTQKKYAFESAQQYGFAFALWQAGKFDAAWEHIVAAQKALGGDHPYLASLAVAIRRDQGRFDEANTLIKAARARFPSAPGLVYGEIDLSLRRKNPKEAVSLCAEALSLKPSDANLHKRIAQAYTELNEQGLAHRALGEYYALLDEPSAAIQQMQIALKAGGDFYQLSAIEARIKELRASLPVDKHGRAIDEKKDRP